MRWSGLKWIASSLVCAGFCTAPASAQPANDTAAICAEAAQRYRAASGRDAAAEAQPVVLMFNYRFCPETLTVKRGVTVRFINVDRRTSHSVWLKKAGKPESDRLFSGEHVDVVMDMPAGAHEVLCGPHWEHQQMVGTVIVTD